MEMLVSFAETMASDEEKNSGPDWLRNLPLRSEDIGFAADELVQCEQCGRPNAPNRSACMYCGAAIHNTQPARLDVREPEQWESGFNVVAVGANDDADVDSAARELGVALGIEPSLIGDMLQMKASIPLARVASEEHANTLSERLRGSGVGTRIVSDESLQPKTPPTRLSSIEFRENEIRLSLFSLEETRSVSSDELVLIVRGTIFESRSESVERKKWRSKKTLSETSIATDEPVVDIYSKSDPTGWRIHATGFDFSCLGSEKSLLVGDNMTKIVEKLANWARGAKVVEDYTNVRSSLEACWPSEGQKHNERLGMHRKDFSNKFATNNISQLTRYSRLQWHLL
jgi:hypothetical protein